MKKKVIVAMSGGVDSSVTAALLKENGFDVIGITMRLADTDREDEPRACCSLSAVEDAKKVAAALNIPHYVIDFTDIFKEKVIDYFLDEYEAGRTPNPCIACNRHIKFAALMKKTDELGADFLATGHYAKIENADGKFLLKKGTDAKKDQSYVLYHLTQKTLARFLLPLGNLTKTETRAVAKKYSLPVAEKAESQEICFVPHDDYRSYLKKHRPHCLHKGNITDGKGNIVGSHDGFPLYTIGQRRGLGIAAEHPLYVVRLDAQKNIVVVGENDETFSRACSVRDINWPGGETPTAPLRVTAKIRYGKREAAANVTPTGSDSADVIFDEPQRAVTPGQSAVFYDGDTVLGGGVIT